MIAARPSRTSYSRSRRPLDGLAGGDEGISGTRGRDKRPGLDALLKGVARREFDIVAQDIEPSPHRVLEHRVKCGPLIPAFRATDPLILVGLDDQPATVLGHLRQHEPLILSGLVVTAHAQVDRCANAIGAHSSAQPSL